jgi:hypothetical protein
MRNSVALAAVVFSAAGAYASTQQASPAATQQSPAPQPSPSASPQPMRFFVTSAGPGNAANLGGLAGADAHCQKLAEAVGAGSRTWRAYLSTQGPDAVNARDRIGTGPWHNAKGVLIAKDVADLHGDVQRDRNNITKESAITEKGETVKGRGDTPNQHDILTGSDSTGRALPPEPDMTCGNWTIGVAGSGGAMVGHHDRVGGGNTSWNSVHRTRGGCSQENLISTGGAGFLYCFAVN